MIFFGKKEARVKELETKVRKEFEQLRLKLQDPNLSELERAGIKTQLCALEASIQDEIYSVRKKHETGVSTRRWPPTQPFPRS